MAMFDDGGKPGTLETPAREASAPASTVPPTSPPWLVLSISMVLGVGIGLVVGHYMGSLSGGAFLGTVGGAILAWGIHKHAIVAALRGAILGGGFAFLIGPFADSMISGAPITEKLLLSLVAGILLGALLGVRNFRVKRKK
ncbi:MAG: hypothetical protein U1D30_02240 [Planctomycetota bacterium]